MSSPTTPPALVSNRPEPSAAVDALGGSQGQPIVLVAGRTLERRPKIEVPIPVRHRTDDPGPETAHIAASPILQHAENIVEGQSGVAGPAQAARLLANDARDIAPQHSAPDAADRQRRVVRIRVVRPGAGCVIGGVLAEVGQPDPPAIRQLGEGAELKVADEVRAGGVVIIRVTGQRGIHETGQRERHVADLRRDGLFQRRQAFVVEGNVLRRGGMGRRHGGDRDHPKNRKSQGFAGCHGFRPSPGRWTGRPAGRSRVRLSLPRCCRCPNGRRRRAGSSRSRPPSGSGWSNAW